MAKTKYQFDTMFDSKEVFDETVVSYKQQLSQQVIINEIPLKFLFCLVGGVKEAAYYLGVCFDNGQGVIQNKDLSNLIFNVSLLLGSKKEIVSQILQGEVLPEWISEYATIIADIVREASKLNHSYKEILEIILSLDKNLPISMLKNIHDSSLSNDFVHIDGAIGYLTFSSEVILDHLTTKRLKSDESRLSTIFDFSESDTNPISYETLVKSRNSDYDFAKIEATGEGSFL